MPVSSRTDNMEEPPPENPSNNQRVPSKSNSAIVPLLLRPSYSRSKSLIFDELRNFRISLKWCALDHSTDVQKHVSYVVFFILAVLVPVLNSVFVNVPKAAYAEDPVSFNKLIQLPESGLALVSFVTLCCFFRRYGLRQLLFLDDLQDDSMFVRRGYSRELDKSFRNLVYILIPSFFFELSHKILFFSTVTVSIPYVQGHGVIALNWIFFVANLASWIYRTGVFLIVCSLFRLTCELQILRFEGFKKQLEGCGYREESGIIFQEHMRIKKQLLLTSHRYRFFIISVMFTVTASQFGMLLLVLGSRTEKTFFNSGDLVVCSAVQLSGFLLSLLGAARITHRAQGIVSIATKWHMIATCDSTNTGLETASMKDLVPATEETVEHDESSSHDAAVVDFEAPDDTYISIPSQEPSSFQTRQALVTYLQHNNGGITVYGFPLDRGLLHTLFAFEFSLVLWILSKVVVLD